MRRGLITLLAVLALPLSTQAQNVERGRDLFEAAPGHGIQVMVGQRMMPARGISCAGCHGRDAGGGAEVQSGPPIDWAGLQAKGYSDDGFAHVLMQGITPEGRMLGGAMPRLGFQHPDDPQALIAYLKVVADLQRSGLTDTQITLRRPPRSPGTQPFWQAFQDQL